MKSRARSAPMMSIFPLFKVNPLEQAEAEAE
jgi:hypothetical protein